MKYSRFESCATQDARRKMREYPLNHDSCTMWRWTGRWSTRFRAQPCVMVILSRIGKASTASSPTVFGYLTEDRRISVKQTFIQPICSESRPRDILLCVAEILPKARGSEGNCAIPTTGLPKQASEREAIMTIIGQPDVQYSSSMSHFYFLDEELSSSTSPSP